MCVNSCLYLSSVVFFWCLASSVLFGLGSGQSKVATTDPVEVAALNSIFQQWNIRSSMSIISWNTTGDPCSGNATLPTSQNLNFRDDDVKFNPAILCRCDSNNTCHIIRLKATNLKIVGTIPDELTKFIFLNNLQISKNYLTGPLPSFIGSFSDMLYLSVGLNSLSGSLPKELGNLTKLISLGLGSRNNFSGPIPPELGNLANLEQMYIDSNGLEGEVPDTLVNLQKLKILWASDNNFGGRVPEFLGNLTRLTSLRLQGNSFEGPIPSRFSNLVKINDLRLGDITNGSSTLAFIRNMNSLNTLILRNCMISDTIPTYIEEFSNITYLDLSFNNLTGKLPSSLFNMPQLTTLYLGNNSISDSLPDQKADGLENIDLSYNQLSGRFPKWVARTNNALNVVANNFAIETNSLPSGLRCLQRDVPCSRGSPNYYSFAINCGGKESITSNGTIYESDEVNLSGASYYMTSTQRWAVSSVGTFMDGRNDNYALYTSKNIANTSDSILFQSARSSPSSLRYYGLGLENGNYTVALQFSEIQFPNDLTWLSFGKRIFDIYLQGILVENEFDIRKESSERSFSAIRKMYLTSVTNNFLEIHFFWAGKGTCCIPFDGSYGSLISAISITPNFVPTVSNQPPNTNKNTTGLIVGITIGVAALLIILAIGFLMWRRCKRRNVYRYNFSELNELTIASGNFSYLELKNATGDFSPQNKLGEGGFGVVYMGRLTKNDRTVAVKELAAGSSQGKQQFIAEVSIISKLKHRNLVNLYGCCYEGNKRLLVYEYMENKSLDKALFGNTGLHLDWPTRYKICLGTAKGLAYLHEESRCRIIHRDIKSSNILLDEDFNPKISDFGLAKLYDDKMTHIMTKVAGTTGYLAPEYAMRGHLTEKVDVYAFGIVILEILSGRSVFSLKLDEDKKYLIEWAWELHEAKRDIEMVDSTLTTFDKEELKHVMGVAFLCAQMNHLLRPTMSRVVSMLLGEAELGEVPSKPTYMSDWSFDNLSGIGQTSSSFPLGNTQSFTFT